jgi:hypothetical protein
MDEEVEPCNGKKNNRIRHKKKKKKTGRIDHPGKIHQQHIFSFSFLVLLV